MTKCAIKDLARDSEFTSLTLDCEPHKSRKEDINQKPFWEKIFRNLLRIQNKQYLAKYS